MTIDTITVVLTGLGVLVATIGMTFGMINALRHDMNRQFDAVNRRLDAADQRITDVRRDLGEQITRSASEFVDQEAVLISLI